MRKIDKSTIVPATLRTAPVPTCAAEVKPEIYKADDVRSQLMCDQGRKCAYCECRVRTAYNDVEHYRPKRDYYWLGHDWNNLLYACNECNRTYKKHFFPLRDETARDLQHQNITNEEPLIVNPAFENPEDHIKFRRHIAVFLSDKGEETIRLLQLNNRGELLQDRKEVYEEYEYLLKAKNIFMSLLQQGKSLNVAGQSIIDALAQVTAALARKCSLEAPYSGMLINQK